MELIGTIKAKGALNGSFDFDQADYNLLKNKPSINGVELVGNKTSEDLHIETGGGGTTDYNNLTNKPMINGIGLIDNKTANDLGLQEEIDFPQDSTKYLDGEGNFTTPPTVGSYDDLTDKPQINSVTLTGNKTGDDLDLSNKAHFTELSGSVVSFQDGQELPLAKCVVDINPTQDLHGYDKPWAPGAGKNKLEITAISATVNDVVFTVNSDGTIKAQGTASANINFNIHPTGDIYFTNDNYTLSGCPTGGSATTYCIKEIYSTGEIDTGNGVTRTYTSSEIHRYAIYIASGTSVDLIFKPMVCLATASNPTIFEPYANICPITPSTEVNITVSNDDETETYTADLGQSVYGGSLNVLTGELNITHEYIDMGTLTWDAVSNQRFASSGIRSTVKIPSSPSTPFDGISEEFNAASNNDVYNHTSDSIIAVNPSGDLVLYNSGFIAYTGAQVKTALNGIITVYELATPQVVQISPEKVKSLLGENHISADKGDIDIIYINNVNDPAIEFILNNL